jgi:hypothetical protein
MPKQADTELSALGLLSRPRFNVPSQGHRVSLEPATSNSGFLKTRNDTQKLAILSIAFSYCLASSHALAAHDGHAIRNHREIYHHASHAGLSAFLSPQSLKPGCPLNTKWLKRGSDAAT